ncbi:MAG: hypothetical protein F4Y02_15735, partial [Chloroflexi bacterium]|nr:hypothetical protein [Chloroflexota bacterium]
MTLPGPIRIYGPWELGVSESPNPCDVTFDYQIEPPTYPLLILGNPPPRPDVEWVRRQGGGP